MLSTGKMQSGTRTFAQAALETGGLALPRSSKLPLIKLCLDPGASTPGGAPAKIRARQTAAPVPAPATITTTTVADPVAAAGDKAEDAEG
ncbi:hypothetical protein [Paracoccus sanguinis]|uniref:hypothetical protein n=1 Tax=Paracoccus sanguinis TaxID=1545044 RepID=UPI00051D9E4F|nr:hypothetical protein [Paracoccus sanguinis]KGJ15480.1 hypothetical protein IX57_15180 [Paracoccus sanguinis]